MGSIESADNIQSPGIYLITTVGDVFSGYMCTVIDLNFTMNLQIAIAYNTYGFAIRQDKGAWYNLQVVIPGT